MNQQSRPYDPTINLQIITRLGLSNNLSAHSYACRRYTKGYYCPALINLATLIDRIASLSPLILLLYIVQQMKLRYAMNSPMYFTL